ncbi:cytochrome P450 [Stereum hirsutum FP-91666 SS1]|uniref:cytochrome P450 n=1 Tax=Stereum hirsutum (strain FP-91666) TaxID=721885 RepID=UPI000440CD92|nr:cytochrome P450 [Stereum hirsutum FP-91666 SS1]EIM90846.1 cytochrome P450 [Stereum hirsutum FP-91666 SS1]
MPAGLEEFRLPTHSSAPTRAMHPQQYRLRFLLDLTKLLIVPQLLFFIILYAIRANYNLRYLWQKIVLHLLVVLFAGLLKVWWSDLHDKRNAASLGAEPIPCVRGKWPGNLDVGMRLISSMNDDYIMQYFAELFDEYGVNTLNTRVLWADQIITRDEQIMKYMLTGAGFEKFHKGPYFQEQFETFIGNGIFNRDGAEWQAHRQLARPWFAKDRISDLNLFEKHTTHTLDMIASLPPKIMPGSVEVGPQAFDAQDLFSCFTLDTASEFLFRKVRSTLDKPMENQRNSAGPNDKNGLDEDRFAAFEQALQDLQERVTRRNWIGSMWPLFELFRDGTARSSAVVHDFLRPLVDEALKLKADRSATLGHVKVQDDLMSAPEDTFLQHLVESTDDSETIKFEVISMLIAARDTTASLLTSGLYFLCIHPEVTARLRQEIVDEYGSNGIPTLERTQNLPYLRAVIEESLRLFPPVAINLRYSTASPQALPPSVSRDVHGVDILGPRYYVPPNTLILYNILLIQRRKDLWGEDAEVFRPERWLGPASACDQDGADMQIGDGARRLAKNPAIFAPFHMGARLCLGQNLAYNEVSYFLIRLLQRFESFELAEDAMPAESMPPPDWKLGDKKRMGRRAIERVWPKTRVTTYISGGLWVRAHPAST